MSLPARSLREFWLDEALSPRETSFHQGEVSWGPATLTQGGGACLSPDVVRIHINGELFVSLSDVRSPDTAGDGLVALSDLQAWHANAGRIVRRVPVQ